MRESFERKPRQRQESLPSLPAITKTAGRYVASLDSSSSITIPTELAENIALTLRVQDKTEEALMAGHKPGFISMLSMLNCRKTISAVSGKKPLKELISRKTSNPENELRKQSELSGVPELMNDVEEMLHQGVIPVLGTKDDMQIEHYLDEHHDDFPAVVHVFNIIPHHANKILSSMFGAIALSRKDIETRLNIDHTFIVLGKDAQNRYICFQKRGPSIHHPFELQDLNSVLTTSINPEKGRMYLSFIAPINMAQEQAPEPQENLLESV